MRSHPEAIRLAFWPLIIPSVCAVALGQELQPRRTLEGHESPVYCIAVSPDGKTLASGARDGLVVCWDVGTGRPRWNTPAHKDNGDGLTQVLSVAFSPDGTTLASGGWDCTVRLWDAATGAPKRTLPHEGLVYSVAFSPDGTILASGEHQTGMIHLWEVGTGKPTGVLERGRGSVWSVAFSPGGNALASGGYIVGRGGGGVVRIWDLSRRTPKLEIPAQATHAVALSPDGRLVASTGSQTRADGHQIDGLVRLWDTRTGELQRTWTVVGDGWESIGPVAFSPDGRLVAAGGMVGERAKERQTGEIYLWNIPSNALVWKQSCHDDDVTGLAFAPDGRTLFSGGRDEAVKLWAITERMRQPSR